MDTIPETDTEFETATITEVRELPDGWELLRNDHWSIFVDNKMCRDVPTVGEECRFYGRGIGYTVRGITIGSRVYQYENPEAHEESQRVMRESLRKEREERDEAFRASRSSLPPLASFQISNQDLWESAVKSNSNDPYSYACVKYAADWAHLMEQRLRLGAALPDIAKETSHEADTGGITGFMYGAAVHMLASCWAFGKELQRWHNASYGVPSTKGTINPAILTIG